jgi:hypothetical protein
MVYFGGVAPRMGYRWQLSAAVIALVVMSGLQAASAGQLKAGHIPVDKFVKIPSGGITSNGKSFPKPDAVANAKIGTETDGRHTGTRIIPKKATAGGGNAKIKMETGASGEMDPELQATRNAQAAEMMRMWKEL